MTDYNHTFEVLKTLPTPLDGYSNPATYEIAENQVSNPAIRLQNSSTLSNNRLYAVEFKNMPESANVKLTIHNAEVLSIFVGNTVNVLNLSGCASMKAIEFSDPGSINEICDLCFDYISSAIELDLTTLSNLRDIGHYAFGAHICFPENKLVIPPNVSSMTVPIVNLNRRYEDRKIDEVVFEPKNIVKFASGTGYIEPIINSENYDKLSSITLNDNAIYSLIYNAPVEHPELVTCFGRSGPTGENKVQYRKLYVDTLSSLHSNYPGAMADLIMNDDCAAPSGDIFTFHKYPLSDLEDQSSNAFDEYKNLIPKEFFIEFVERAFALSGLSVWVPAALYDAWCAEWPNYTSSVYPYGYVPEPPTPTPSQDGTFTWTDSDGEHTEYLSNLNNFAWTDGTGAHYFCIEHGIDNPDCPEYLAILSDGEE